MFKPLHQDHAIESVTFRLTGSGELTENERGSLDEGYQKAFKEEQERMIGAAALMEKDKLVVHAGARHTALRWRDLGNYLGARAQRGRLLPRGFQRVDGLSVA